MDVLDEVGRQFLLLSQLRRELVHIAHKLCGGILQVELRVFVELLSTVGVGDPP